MKNIFSTFYKKILTWISPPKKEKRKRTWDSPGMTGKKHSKRTRKKMSKAHLGKKRPKEVREKISNTLKGKQGKEGPENPQWKGGVSFAPYSIGWNKRKKENVRKKYNYTCQECGIKQSEVQGNLTVHHINENKHDNREENLTLLCTPCHSRFHYQKHKFRKRIKND